MVLSEMVFDVLEVASLEKCNSGMKIDAVWLISVSRSKL